jgi:hypothetical protein
MGGGADGGAGLEDPAPQVGAPASCSPPGGPVAGNVFGATVEATVSVVVSKIPGDAGVDAVSAAPAQKNLAALHAFGVGGTEFLVLFAVSVGDGASRHAVPQKNEERQLVNFVPPTAEQIVENYLARSGVKVETTFDVGIPWASATYSKKLDLVRVLPVGEFDSVDARNSTLLHELAHSTGHPDRLDRPLSFSSMSVEFWVEELIAETAATFLDQVADVQGMAKKHAEYTDPIVEALRLSDDSLAWVRRYALRVAEFVYGGGLSVVRHSLAA